PRRRDPFPLLPASQSSIRTVMYSNPQPHLLPRTTPPPSTQARPSHSVKKKILRSPRTRAQSNSPRQPAAHASAAPGTPRAPAPAPATAPARPAVAAAGQRAANTAAPVPVGVAAAHEKPAAVAAGDVPAACAAATAPLAARASAHQAAGTASSAADSSTAIPRPPAPAAAADNNTLHLDPRWAALAAPTEQTAPPAVQAQASEAAPR